MNLHDYTKSLIVHGADVDNASKYGSRSEALWRVVCDMVRAGADDQTIASVILEPGFKISSSVLDKAGPQQYADDQITKAREEVINPALRELNNTHFVIESDRGARCVVAEEDWDDVMNRWHIKYQSFDSFRNRYMHRTVQIGSDKNNIPITMPLGKWWLMQELRRQYRKIVFSPGREVRPNEFNLWRGFNCTPKAGDQHLGFLNLLLDVLCKGVLENYQYMLGWLSRSVQYPGEPGEVAIILKGKKGTGKSFSARAIGQLFGQHFMQVYSSKMVVGDFNGHLRDCVFLFADEAFHAGNKQHESILKGLITEKFIMIEAKGIDAVMERNCLHIMMASNDDWVVPASADERRYFVLDVSDKRIGDRAYFKEIQRQLDGGGREHLLAFLLAYDLENYDPRNVPATSGLEDQKIASLAPQEQAVLELLAEGALPNNANHRPDTAAMLDQPVMGGLPLLGLYEFAQKRIPDMKYVSTKTFATALRKVGCEPVRLHAHQNRHGWQFLPLGEARRRFNEAFGAYEWPDDQPDWESANREFRSPF